jgi:hypothetical protein
MVQTVVRHTFFLHYSGTAAFRSVFDLLISTICFRTLLAYNVPEGLQKYPGKRFVAVCIPIIDGLCRPTTCKLHPKAQHSKPLVSFYQSLYGQNNSLNNVSITPPYSLRLLPLRVTLYTTNNATTTSTVTPTTPANQSTPQLQAQRNNLHSLRSHHYTGYVVAVCYHYRTVNYGSTSSDAVEVKISPSAPSDRMGRHLAFSTQPTSSTHYSMCSASVQQGWRYRRESHVVCR